MVKVRCRGKLKSRMLHKTPKGKHFIMERKSGGGVKRLYGNVRKGAFIPKGVKK